MGAREWRGRSMKSYAEFKSAIKVREGANDYHSVNSIGFLGAYQFGLARLCDLNITRRIDSITMGMGNRLFEFIPPLTREIFLGSPGLQDAVFDSHIMKLKGQCLKLVAFNLSGAIAASHLLGFGGLKDYILNGVDGVDGYGTKISSYYELFRGYEIP